MAQSNLQRWIHKALCYPIVREYLRYTVIATVGITLHAAIMFAATELLSVPYMVSFCFGLPASHTVKFTLDKLWTFQK
jgi:putative flippase GtrA